MTRTCIVIASIVLFAQLFVGCSSKSDTPETIVEKFVNAYFARNIDEASEFISQDMRDEFIEHNSGFDEEALRLFSDLSKMKTEILRTSNVPKDQEEVICYFLNENDEKVYRWRFYLKKNGETWEIVSFRKIGRINID